MQIRYLALALAALASLAIFGSTSAKAQGRPFFAVLNGGNVCSGTQAHGPPCRTGDLNAYGSATIIFPTATSACAGVVITGGTKVAQAQIYGSQAGANGLAFVNFSPLAPTSAVQGSWGRCVTGLNAGVVAAIKANPSNYYFMISTTGVAPDGFPNGAVRGQLF